MCDKCGREVQPNNDATLFESILSGQPMVMLIAQPRHLLPVIENGEVVCEGSPSRAQYLPDQPRDTRGYTYTPQMRWLYQMVYKIMQLEAASMRVGAN